MKKLPGKFRALYLAVVICFFCCFGAFALYLNQPIYGVRYCLNENKFMQDVETIDQIKPIFMQELLKENETRPVAEVTETANLLFDALRECFDQQTAYECLIVHSYPLHRHITYPRSHQVALEKLDGRKHILWGEFDLNNDGTQTHLVGIQDVDKDWVYSITVDKVGCGFQEKFIGTSGSF